MIVFKTEKNMHEIIQEGAEEVLYLNNKRMGVVKNYKDIAVGKRAQIDYYKIDKKGVPDLWTLTTTEITEVEK